MMDMETLVCPIVGSHFVPPAKLLLESLPNGAELKLSPNPANPYDAKAIEVWVEVGELPLVVLAYLDFQAKLAGYGHDLESLKATSKFMLGHIADSDGKMAQGGPGNREVHELVAGLAPDTASVEEAWAEAQGKLNVCFRVEERMIERKGRLTPTPTYLACVSKKEPQV